MIRLLGGIVGSALAVALLLLLVGIPQFRAPATTAESTIVTLPLKTSPVERPAGSTTYSESPDSEAAVATSDQPGVRIDSAVETPALADIAVDRPPAETDAADLATVPREDMNAATQVLAEQETLRAESRWYPFWSPFRSEIAARGFVARLSSVTGIDYRIDRIDSGAYQVAFAYQNDDDIADKLSRITAATGLELASR